MAKSRYLSELFLGWVMGKAFPNPPLALYLSLHTSDPDFNGAGECDAFGLKRRGKVELAALGMVQTPSNRFILTNTSSLELGEVKVRQTGVLFLGVWDRETIGDGNLLFYSQLPAPRDLMVGDRVLLPAQSFSLEEK